MDRLTERFNNGQAAVFGCGSNCRYDFKYCHNALEDCPAINKILERLAEYEDLEEKGQLLKPPCAVGDTVYRIHKATELSPDKVYNCRVTGVKQEYNSIYIKLYANINKETYSIWIDNWFDKCQMGYEFFLTEQEAEQALQKSKGGQLMIDEKKLLDELIRKDQSLQKHLKHAEDNGNELFNFGLKSQLAMLKSIISCISKQPQTDKWIPYRDRLPEEPSKIPLTVNELEQMVEDEIFQECIVMMYGAKKSTTLYYTGNGEWYDPVTEEFYDVTAWQPLPEPYKPNNQAAVQKGDNP